MLLPQPTLPPCGSVADFYSQHYHHVDLKLTSTVNITTMWICSSLLITNIFHLIGWDTSIWIGAKYSDWVCRWYQGKQSSNVAEFFWHHGHSFYNPQGLFIASFGWDVRDHATTRTTIYVNGDNGRLMF